VKDSTADHGTRHVMNILRASTPYGETITARRRARTTSTAATMSAIGTRRDQTNPPPDPPTKSSHAKAAAPVNAAASTTFQCGEQYTPDGTTSSACSTLPPWRVSTPCMVDGSGTGGNGATDTSR
jgi:hypothetical protein